jgi:hypothetical protein
MASSLTDRAQTPSGKPLLKGILMTEMLTPEQTTLTPFDGLLVTIHSEKSFFEVTKAIESRLQRFSIAKLMEYVTHGDREGLEAYVDEVSAPTKFSIFWSFEQGSTMRLAGIPIESKFYLVGNAVIVRGLFRYSGAAGLGAPVRVCVSQRDGGQTRIDMDLPSAFFKKFPEMRASATALSHRRCSWRQLHR